MHRLIDVPRARPRGHPPGSAGVSTAATYRPAPGHVPVRQARGGGQDRLRRGRAGRSRPLRLGRRGRRQGRRRVAAAAARRGAATRSGWRPCSAAGNPSTPARRCCCVPAPTSMPADPGRRRCNSGSASRHCWSELSGRRRRPRPRAGHGNPARSAGARSERPPAGAQPRNRGGAAGRVCASSLEPCERILRRRRVLRGEVGCPATKGRGCGGRPRRRSAAMWWASSSGDPLDRGDRRSPSGRRRGRRRRRSASPRARRRPGPASTPSRRQASR